MPKASLITTIRAVVDFHLSYAADPAASCRLGFAVLIAGSQAVEHLDLKVASAVQDVQLADCEAPLPTLRPADFRALRKADPYLVELPAQHSALADWPLVDCLVPDDLVLTGCSD